MAINKMRDGKRIKLAIGGCWNEQFGVFEFDIHWKDFLVKTAPKIRIWPPIFIAYQSTGKSM